VASDSRPMIDFVSLREFLDDEDSTYGHDRSHPLECKETQETGMIFSGYYSLFWNWRFFAELERIHSFVPSFFLWDDLRVPECIP
jgi:hypothetical protein